MRSTHRKTKRRSCGLCKPHKLGWAPKDTAKQQALERASMEEVREAEMIADWWLSLRPNCLEDEMVRRIVAAEHPELVEDEIAKPESPLVS